MAFVACVVTVNELREAKATLKAALAAALARFGGSHAFLDWFYFGGTRPRRRRAGLQVRALPRRSLGRRRAASWQRALSSAPASRRPQRQRVVRWQPAGVALRHGWQWGPGLSRTPGCLAARLQPRGRRCQPSRAEPSRGACCGRRRPPPRVAVGAWALPHTRLSRCLPPAPRQALPALSRRALARRLLRAQPSPSPLLLRRLLPADAPSCRCDRRRRLHAAAAGGPTTAAARCPRGATARQRCTQEDGEEEGPGHAAAFAHLGGVGLGCPQSSCGVAPSRLPLQPLPSLTRARGARAPAAGRWRTPLLHPPLRRQARRWLRCRSRHRPPRPLGRPYPLGSPQRLPSRLHLDPHRCCRPPAWRPLCRGELQAQPSGPQPTHSSIK